MATEDVLNIQERPDWYSPPKPEEVFALLEMQRRARQPVIDRIWEVKKVRRGEWQEVVRKLPKSYRKMLIDPDLPQVRDFIQRAVGLISKNEPNFEVMPPGQNLADVSKAGKEELRLNALRIQLEDQQDRPIYAMGIDAQAAWGESWISVYPDPKRCQRKGYERGKDEDGKAYSERYKYVMADGGVPMIMTDDDPQTVFPYRLPDNTLGFVMVETEHQVADIDLGLGYTPLRGEKGERKGWTLSKKTLSEGYVPVQGRASLVSSSDHKHDTGISSTGQSGAGQAEKPVRKVVYVDCWIYQCYLDGQLVEEWEHDFGVVPMFPAYGEQSSDRDIAWQSIGIADAAMSVAKQIVMWTAVIASSGMQHGFPTPFIKNAETGLVDPQTGQQMTRTIRLGEANLLGLNEEIVFPYLQAHTGRDFGQHLEFLMGQLEQTTLSNFGKAIGSDIAGYAVAQIRSMQTSILSTIYGNAKRQWRKIAYFLRHLVATYFPAGIALRAAVEEDENGRQYRPIVEYGKSDVTMFPIEVDIQEGIPQDEIAQNKNAIEMQQAGLWSVRRAMERSGVEDPAAERQEINIDRVLNSPNADQIVLQMAVKLATQRFEATQQQQSNPFMQELEKVKGDYLGGPGQFNNQGGMPENADGAGPLNQQEPVNTGNLAGFGIPQKPGGVEGVDQLAAGALG